MKDAFGVSGGPSREPPFSRFCSLKAALL